MKTDKEIAEKARERAKKQNEAAKNNWDCISCRLPKGTKDRIQALGYTVNGFLNIIVLAELERLEAEAPQTAQQENEQKRLQEVARRQANVEAENGYD